jgi:hypothetical protein
MICKICRKELEFNFDEETLEKMRKTRLCFGCTFWEEKVALRKINDPNAVVIKGKHYYMGKEEKQSEYELRGFGGQEFNFRFLSGKQKGKIIKTTNLWYNGEIPEQFKDKLTDNAKFVVPKGNKK